MWAWLWFVWIVTFAVLETWAIVTKQKGGTLSETLRMWLGIYPVTWWRLIGASLVIGGAIWFVGHILFEGYPV